MDDLYLREKRNGPKMIVALVLYSIVMIALAALIVIYVF